MRITVIGTGYPGAVHAASVAGIGHDVIGAGAEPERIGRGLGRAAR